MKDDYDRDGRRVGLQAEDYVVYVLVWVAVVIVLILF